MHRREIRKLAKMPRVKNKERQEDNRIQRVNESFPLNYAVGPNIDGARR